VGATPDELDDDARVVAALRAGNEGVFAALIDLHHAALMRVARGYVSTKEAAEDVVQETWLAVVKGIDRFEARSSLKTWIFHIMINQAKTRGVREARSRPFSSLATAADEPVVDPARFIDSGRWTGFWSEPPSRESIPERRLLAAEVGERLLSAIERLPETQRTVITLRDVEGQTSPDVCELLSISEGNQRILLHRARSKVRAELEGYLDDRAAVI